MGLAYSLKCSLLCSYFYSLAPLLSFSFSHVLAPRVSPIPPEHIASRILHRPFHPDVLQSEFFPPPFHTDISHPNFFIAHSIRMFCNRNSSRRHSTRTSHIRNSPPANIPPGHIAFRILHHPFHQTSRIRNPSRRHSIRMSHIRNSSPPPFYMDISHPEFFPPPFHLDVSNPESYPPTFQFLFFFFILRAFSLGSKITFLIKLCCRFYFWQAIFILPPFLKCFEISKESNSEQWSYRNWFRQDKTGFGGGPTYVTDRLIDRLIDLIAMYDWFILFTDVYAIIPKLCNNSLSLNSAWWLIA